MGDGEWITLNVGGTKFTTTPTRTVLTKDPDSMFARMFEHEAAMQPAAKDNDGAYLVDGNPKYFDPILHFLRRGKIVIDPGVSHRGVLLEAKYFGVQSMVDKLKSMVKTAKVGSIVRVIMDQYGNNIQGTVSQIYSVGDDITSITLSTGMVISGLALAMLEVLST